MIRRPYVRIACAAWLSILCLAALFAGYLAPYPYEQQLREAPDAPPSAAHLLGTDAIGRDRFSRLLYGARTSLVLAPAAALLSIASAALIGGIAGGSGGWIERLLLAGTDLTMAMPWLFLLISVRAVLPLDVSPAVSVCVTFALLGLLGWAGPARVVHAGIHEIRASDYMLAAAARGIGPVRRFLRHALPNLSPVFTAQFWTAVPGFIIAEANLGMLGLGVAEPLPSWGSLLRELESQPWTPSYVVSHAWLLSPLLLVMSVIVCCRVVFRSEVI